MINYPKNYAPLAEEEMEYTSGGLSFFFNETATTDTYTLSNTLSQHDALPIYLKEMIFFFCFHIFPAPQSHPLTRVEIGRAHV